MIAFVGVAWAGGFEVAQQSAVAGGTGHASTARPDDAASAWFDPAALADDAGLRVAAGVALAAATIEAQSVATTGESWQTTSTNPLATPPHLYVSVARNRLLAGVAANTAFAGGVRWPDDGPLRFESTESSPRFLRIAPFVGGRLGRLRLAGGVHVDAGSLLVRKATDHVSEEGAITIALRGTGIGADASLYVAATEALSVGLSYKSRTRLALAGEADFDLPAPFSAGFPDQDASAVWTLPDRLALGVAWSEESWRLLLDGVLTAWSVNDALRIDFADPATADAIQTNLWRNSLAVRGGAEVRVDVFTLRAGGYVDTPPSPVSTLVASSPDGPRTAATIGAGVGLGDRVRLDAYGEWLRIGPRTSTTGEALPASYRGRAIVAGLTAALTL